MKEKELRNHTVCDNRGGSEDPRRADPDKHQAVRRCAMFANRHRFTLSAVLWAVLWVVATPAFSADRAEVVLSASMGTAQNNSNNAALYSIDPYSSVSESGSSSAFAYDFALGVSRGAWGVELGYTGFDDFRASATGYGATGSSVGDHVYAETSKTQIGDDSVRLVLTRRIDLSEEFALTVNAGVHKWHRSTATQSVQNENVLVLNPVTGLIEHDIIRAETFTIYGADEAINATYGLSLSVHDDHLWASIGAQYYVGLDTLYPFVRVGVQLF